MTQDAIPFPDDDIPEEIWGELLETQTLPVLVNNQQTLVNPDAVVYAVSEFDLAGRPGPVSLYVGTSRIRVSDTLDELAEVLPGAVVVDGVVPNTNRRTRLLFFPPITLASVSSRGTTYFRVTNRNGKAERTLWTDLSPEDLAAITPTVSVERFDGPPRQDPTPAGFYAMALGDIPAHRGVVIQSTKGGWGVSLPEKEDDQVVGFTTRLTHGGVQVFVATGPILRAEVGSALAGLPPGTRRPVKIDIQGRVAGLAGNHPEPQHSQAFVLTNDGKRLPGEKVNVYFFGGNLRETLPPDAG